MHVQKSHFIFFKPKCRCKNRISIFLRQNAHAKKAFQFFLRQNARVKCYFNFEKVKMAEQKNITVL